MSGRHQVQDATGVVVSDGDGNYLVSASASAPSDSAVGYQTGALHLDTSNKRHHINVGTAASSAWARSSPVREVINVTSATKTLVLADSGSLVVLDLATGIVVTLPEANAANTGWYCDFLIKTTISGSNVINIDAYQATDLFYGYLSLNDHSAATAANNRVFFADQSNDDQIVLGQSDNTQGKMYGGVFRVEIAGVNMLVCSGQLQSDGTAITPFA